MKALFVTYIIGMCVIGVGLCFSSFSDGDVIEAIIGAVMIILTVGFAALRVTLREEAE